MTIQELKPGHFAGIIANDKSQTIQVFKSLGGDLVIVLIFDETMPNPIISIQDAEIYNQSNKIENNWKKSNKKSFLLLYRKIYVNKFEIDSVREDNINTLVLSKILLAKAGINTDVIRRTNNLNLNTKKYD